MEGRPPPSPTLPTGRRTRPTRPPSRSAASRPAASRQHPLPCDGASTPARPHSRNTLLVLVRNNLYPDAPLPHATPARHTRQPQVYFGLVSTPAVYSAALLCTILATPAIPRQHTHAHTHTLSLSHSHYAPVGEAEQQAVAYSMVSPAVAMIAPLAWRPISPVSSLICFYKKKKGRFR